MMASGLIEKFYQIVILLSIVFATLCKAAQSEGCPYYMTNNATFVTSPNFGKTYPKSTDCGLRFITTPGNKYKLIFLNFDLEYQENCKYDYVALYNGHSQEDDALLGKFCGSRLPYRPIVSTTNKMLVVFHSDGSNEYKGFQAMVASGFDYFINQTEGIITSPNFGSKEGFSLYKICIWEFQTIPGRRIELVFDSFQLVPGENCTNSSFVALFDGATVNDPMLGRSCSTWDTSPITSTTHNLVLVLSTFGYQSAAGFKATYATDINSYVIDETGKKLTRSLLNLRQGHTNLINKWGVDITKVAVALFLQDPQFFAAGNETGERIAYELTSQLMSKLVLRKRVSTKDLALFVNAMTVACINPRNFYGVDVVAELHKRVDHMHSTNPFFILTLCNAGENLTTEYVRKLQSISSEYLQSSLIEIQAMVAMALKCVLRQSNNDHNNTLTELVEKLKRKQDDGTIDNIKDAALLLQAFIASENYPFNFPWRRAMYSLVRSIKHKRLSTEEIYYILPVMKKKTLLDINSYHCEKYIKTELEVVTIPREQPDVRIQVQISVIIGSEIDFTRTWKIKVPSNYSLYQAMENITISEPDYKFQYRNYEDKPYVAGLATFQNSVADDSFWFIFTKPLLSDDNPVLVNESPVDIQVNETNEIILWYRSGFLKEKIDESS